MAQRECAFTLGTAGSGSVESCKLTPFSHAPMLPEKSLWRLDSERVLGVDFIGHERPPQWKYWFCSFFFSFCRANYSHSSSNKPSTVSEIHAGKPSSTPTATSPSNKGEELRSANPALPDRWKCFCWNCVPAGKPNTVVFTHPPTTTTTKTPYHSKVVSLRKGQRAERTASLRVASLFLNRHM